MNEHIPDDLNLFMMCEKLNNEALSELPPEYHVRNCRKNELEIWKAIHFDDPEQAKEYSGFMDQYFTDVYGKKEELFFRKCLFVCDVDDIPIATCFAWKAYDKITTLHWFKVVKRHEGKGIGRALLSIVMKELKEEDYPVFLHTQPGSYRAIKLYSDFGFSLLTDDEIGFRKNHFKQCLPILKTYMLHDAFGKLTTAKAPQFFLEAVKSSTINQF